MQALRKTDSYKLRTVDMSKLKAFVENNFPQGSPLQVVFIGEDDLLSAEAFLAKLPIWLKLIRFSSVS